MAVSWIWVLLALYLAVVGTNLWRVLHPATCPPHAPPELCVWPVAPSTSSNAFELWVFASPHHEFLDAHSLGRDDDRGRPLSRLVFAQRLEPGAALERNATLPFSYYGTRRNGSLFSHTLLLPSRQRGSRGDDAPLSLDDWAPQQQPPLAYVVSPLTRYLPPRVFAAKSLLGAGDKPASAAAAAAPALAAGDAAPAVPGASSCASGDDEGAGGGTCVNPSAAAAAPAAAEETSVALPPPPQSQPQPLASDAALTHVRPRLVLRLAHPQPPLLAAAFPNELRSFLFSEQQRVPGAPGGGGGSRVVNVLRYRPLFALDESAVLRRQWRLVRQLGANESDGAVADPLIVFKVAPVGVGTFSIYRQLESSLAQLAAFGFSESDLEEFQELVSGSNLRWWALTTLISLLHGCFSYLAFSSDVGFWRGKTRLEGLSIRSFFSSFVCQLIILLKLLDGGNVSRLILAEVGIGCAIEGWKGAKQKNTFFIFHSFFSHSSLLLNLILVLPPVSKILTRRGWLSLSFLRGGAPAEGTEALSQLEEDTDAADARIMRWLCIAIGPILAVWGVYSLYKHRYKSWWSWAIQTAAHGVYLYGFVAMTPQLYSAS